MDHLHRTSRMGLAALLGLALGCSSAADGPRLLEPIPAVGGGDASGRRYSREEREAQCAQTGGSWQASGAFGEIGQYCQYYTPASSWRYTGKQLEAFCLRMGGWWRAGGEFADYCEYLDR
jgi:hypothetical protein